MAEIIKMKRLSKRSSGCSLPRPAKEYFSKLVELAEDVEPRRSEVMASCLMTLYVGDIKEFRRRLDNYSEKTFDAPRAYVGFEWPNPVFDRSKALLSQGRAARISRDDLIGFALMSTSSDSDHMERLVLAYRKLDSVSFDPRMPTAPINLT